MVITIHTYPKLREGVEGVEDMEDISVDRRKTKRSQGEPFRIPQEE